MQYRPLGSTSLTTVLPGAKSAAAGDIVIPPALIETLSRL